jgi:hypothetical protein
MMERPDTQGLPAGDFQQRRMALAGLLACYFLVCSTSFLLSLDHSDHHLAYVSRELPKALAWAAAFSLVALPFTAARFTFGYFISFNFYTIMLGFILLSWFTGFAYDHQAARISAAASFVAFFLPALFLSIPVPRPKISQSGFELVLNLLIAFCIATVAIGATYNFNVAGLGSIYDFRPALSLPVPVGYLTGMASSSILPFLFATFVMQRRAWRALLTLALLLLFYPITLTKMAFFSPIWLLWLAILLRFFDARVAVVLSLFLPLISGVVLYAIFPEQARAYFELVNFRMITTPASALNVYNDFFARHDQTGFCQITLLQKLLACPKGPALPAILEKIYGLGYFNASLFATEGIASVGLRYAPAIAFVCGLIMAVGNCVSHGLPPRFIVLSSAVISQYLLNVPLTIVLLTHGAALLFLLWYLTPRVALDPIRQDLRAASLRVKAGP